MFQETAVASAALQRKDVHLAVSHTLVEGVLKRLQELRTESEFRLFEKAKERAEAAGIEFPDKYPVSQDPEKYLQGISTVPSQQEKTITLRIWRSSTEQGVLLYYTFLDTFTQEMLRRFKGKDNSSTGIILKGLHSLTVASKWSNLVMLNLSEQLVSSTGLRKKRSSQNLKCSCVLLLHQKIMCRKC